MLYIPDSVKKQIANPQQPDWKQFKAVMTGQTKPSRVHLAELFADQDFMRWVTENIFEKKWVPYEGNRKQVEQHLLCEIEYWYRMGYDYIRVAGGINFDWKSLPISDTAALSTAQRNWANMSAGPIQSWNDYERYQWPNVSEETTWMYEFVADNLPEGMGIMACPSSGFLEIPAEILIGFESLAMMMYDQPDLLEAVFRRVRNLIVRAYELIIDIPEVVGCFQGDDMGFRTGTLMPPEFLRSHVFPGHKQIVDLAHSRDKLYFLHSCGNLENIMDSLIDEVGIDGKHSYEDAIVPVEQMYKQYSSRIAIVGGIDVNILAMSEESFVRKRVKEILACCTANGRHAMGSGNTITNYCKPQNVLAMLDEAYCWKNGKCY